MEEQARQKVISSIQSCVNIEQINIVSAYLDFYRKMFPDKDSSRLEKLLKDKIKALSL